MIRVSVIYANLWWGEGGVNHKLYNLRNPIQQGMQNAHGLQLPNLQQVPVIQKLNLGGSQN